MQCWVSVLLAVCGGASLTTCGVVRRSIDYLSMADAVWTPGLDLSSATHMLCLTTSVALLAPGRLLEALACAMGNALFVDIVGKSEVGYE